MIQRVQSIFLLISSISFFSLFAVPFAKSDTSIPHLMSDMIYNVQDHIVMMVMAGLGGVATLGAIFLYNNRNLQLKISNVSIILGILIPLIAILLIYNEGTFTAHAAQIKDKLGIYLPILGVIFSGLASKYIKKDENTVQSMDRLR